MCWVTLKSQYLLTFTLRFPSELMTFHPAHPNTDKQQVYSPVHQCSFNRLVTGDTIPVEGGSSHQT